MTDFPFLGELSLIPATFDTSNGLKWNLWVINMKLCSNETYATESLDLQMFAKLEASNIWKVFKVLFEKVKRTSSCQKNMFTQTQYAKVVILMKVITYYIYLHCFMSCNVDFLYIFLFWSTINVQSISLVYPILITSTML